MTVKTFSVDEMATIVGVHEVKGVADGEYLRITRSGVDWTKKVGVDGEVVRSKNLDNSAEIVIILMASSASNAAFTAQRILDLSTKNGAGLVPFLTQDGQGGDRFAAESCWISAPPNPVWSGEVEMREWTFECDELFDIHGGA